MNNPHAIVIVYTGDAPTEGTMADIVRILMTRDIITNVENVDIFECNSEDIAKRLVPTFINRKESSVLSAQENALIYIGTLLENSHLSVEQECIKVLQFIVQSSRIDEKMKKAVRILADGTSNIRAEYKKKYKLNPMFKNIILSANQLI